MLSGEEWIGDGGARNGGRRKVLHGCCRVHCASPLALALSVVWCGIYVRVAAAFERANPINLNWQPVTASAPPADAAITWFRANITTPSVRAEADPSQTAFALNLYGAMNKGTA